MRYHGFLYDRSAFWVATNSAYPDQVNISFNDPNRISELLSSAKCRIMGQALFDLADHMEKADPPR